MKNVKAKLASFLSVLAVMGWGGQITSSIPQNGQPNKTVISFGLEPQKRPEKQEESVSVEDGAEMLQYALAMTGSSWAVLVRADYINDHIGTKLVARIDPKGRIIVVDPKRNT